MQLQCTCIHIYVNLTALSLTPYVYISTYITHVHINIDITSSASQLCRFIIMYIYSFSHIASPCNTDDITIYVASYQEQILQYIAGIFLTPELLIAECRKSQPSSDSNPLQATCSLDMSHGSHIAKIKISTCIQLILKQY